MDNVFVIDAGNSAVKWASSNSNELSAMLSLSYPENITADFLIDEWKSLAKPKNVIASCVASEVIWQALAKACDELWDIKAQRVASLEKGYGLMNAYNKASDLGSDRWCAMLGVLHNTDSAFIVVDVGSAITVDLVDESGQHIGGYILPGLNMMKQSLGLQTAQVKVAMVQNLTPSLSLGKTTEECVESGIYLSAVKLIEAIFEKESKRVNKLECYLTGGDAKLIADLLPVKCIIMPDAVLRGLAVISSNDLKNNKG